MGAEKERNDKVFAGTVKFDAAVEFVVPPTGIPAGSVPDPLLLNAGVVANPTYSFSGDPDTGVFNEAADELGFGAGGVLIAKAKEAAGANQFIVSPGVNQNNAISPSLSFGLGDSGFYEDATLDLSVAVGGLKNWEWKSNFYQSNNVNGPAMINRAPTLTLPVFVPNQADTNTGLSQFNADQVHFVCGGIVASQWREASSHILMFDELHTGITANVTQTQGQTPLLSSYNEITVVANPNDVVTLTPATVGLRQTVVNTGANILQIFPESGDDLGKGVDTSMTLAVGKSVTFLGQDTTNWDQQSNTDPAAYIAGITGGTEALPSLSFGDGDTGFFENADDQLHLSLLGTERFKWVVISAEGRYSGLLPGSALMRDVNASATIPSLCPDQGDIDTGIGQATVNQLSLIAGGVQIAQAKESTVDQFIVSPGALLGTTALPALAFGDTDTGFTETSDDVLVVSTAGLPRFIWSANIFGADQAAGPALLNEDASSTNPTLVPNQADDDTGIGRDTVDGLAFIAGGVSCMRVREIAAAPAVAFYTTTPIIQQTGVAVTDVGIHAALVNLGLFTA